MIDEAQKNEVMFQSLLMMFETAAMQNMGKLKNPVTGKIEKDLQQAQYAIDILDMLKEKTKNNASDTEKRMMESIVASLKLTYVDELSKSPKESTIPSTEEQSTSNAQ